MDPISSADKEESPVETELEVKLTMSDNESKVDPEAIVRDKLAQDENSTSADVDVEQLIQSRMADLKQKQVTQRAAWRLEVEAELAKRAENKRRMESTPRNQVTSWKDKQIFSNISIPARKTFQREKCHFLFPDVFPILSKDNLQFSVFLPGNKVIDHCRLVSKLWKDVVDSTLSRTSCHNLDLIAGPHVLPLDPNPILFKDVGKLTDFNRKSEALSPQEYPDMNPFPFHQLYIGVPLLAQIEGLSGNLGPIYWTEIGKLLERWGNEIWTAQYVFDDGSVERMYEHLINYLILMPNLQELTVLERDRSGTVGTDMLRALGKDVLGPLKLMMERKPLPDLPQLRSIVFQEFTPGLLIEAALAKYGEQLEALEMGGSGFDNFTGKYVDLARVVAGRELPFKKYSCVYEDSSRITEWKYQFPEVTKMDLTYLKVPESSKVDNIFKTVNSCGPSLRRLRLNIQFNGANTMGQNGERDLLPIGVKLELPHLEWLDLTVERSKVRNVDFLLPLVSLKELTFSHQGESESGGNGIIQFGGYRNRMYESNLWSLFPEMRKVTINSVPSGQTWDMRFGLRVSGYPGFVCDNMTTIIHTREGYRQHQNRIQNANVTEGLATVTIK